MIQDLELEQAAKTPTASKVTPAMAKTLRFFITFSYLGLDLS